METPTKNKQRKTAMRPELELITKIAEEIGRQDLSPEAARELALQELKRAYINPGNRKNIVGMLEDPILSEASDNLRAREAIRSVIKQLSRSEAGESSDRTGADDGPAFSSIKPSALSDKTAQRADDLLGYEVYARSLVDFFTHPDSKPPYSVAIAGGWGSGKTTLMRWVRDELESRGYVTSWFSAWRHDKKNAVWAAFASQLIADAITPRRRWSLYWNRLQDAYPVKWILAAIALGFLGWDLPFILQHLFGTSATDMSISVMGKLIVFAAVVPAAWPVVKTLRSPLITLTKAGRGPNYSAVLGFQGEFEQDFRRFVVSCGTEDRPLFVFVDDLDRAPLPTSVEIIEAMSLLLGEENCVFVVGLDLDIVSASIETKYSEVIQQLEKNSNRESDFTGRDFLEKLFQITFTIPRLTEHQFQRFVGSLLGDDARSGKGSSVASTGSETPLPFVSDAEDGYYAAFEEARQKTYLERFSDSPEAKQAMLAAIRFLPRNPRKVKRFLNTFRLLAFLANRRGLIRTAGFDLTELAVITSVALEYPAYFRIFRAEDFREVFASVIKFCDLKRAGTYTVSADSYKNMLEAIRVHGLRDSDIRPELRDLFSFLSAVKNRPLYLSLSTVIEDQAPKATEDDG